MRIGAILKETQPKNYKKVTSIKKKKADKLTEKDIQELMYHSSYKRSSRGAIKQVR